MLKINYDLSRYDCGRIHVLGVDGNANYFYFIIKYVSCWKAFSVVKRCISFLRSRCKKTKFKRAEWYQEIENFKRNL
jgi:hypothetical protein